jgi:hypothetical protein
LRDKMLKILLQHNRPEAAIAVQQKIGLAEHPDSAVVPRHCRFSEIWERASLGDLPVQRVNA